MTDRTFGTRFKRALSSLLVVASCGYGGALAAQEAAEAIPELDLALPAAARPQAQVQVFVELADPPAARVYGTVLATSKLPRRQAVAAAVTAAKSQLQRIDSAQAQVSARLTGAGAREFARAQKVLNGIAVWVDADRIDALRRLPGVKAARLLEPEYPTNSSSIPFLGTPAVWGDTLGLGLALRGEGISVGIIDSGIDYQHANFGGTGALASYQANDRTIISDGFFPNSRVVGGMDFVGDAYTGTNTPTPDPDPMDCGGHGTHVAGTAGGSGVSSDGSQFTGPYDGTVPFGSLRIGPGVAPAAQLYALRVFGCVGSTTVTFQGIEWAVDPNDDGDFSDHLDVINMSLGSNFGTITTQSASAAENAALAGVVVVAASGNAGDTYYITSSPGVADHAISVAASADSGVASGVIIVNSPPAIAGPYSAAGSSYPDPTPPPPPAASGQTGELILALDAADAAGPLTTDGCTAPFTNAAAVAGKIALIDRGTCAFTVKVANAEAAGAIGVIIANSAANSGDPIPPGLGGTAAVDINIPAVGTTTENGTTFKNQLLLGTVNVTLAAATAADTMASFSGRGPRINSNRLKPDISAPGVLIVSAQTGVTCLSGACQRPDPSGFVPDNQPLTLQGTSMATPHVAGVMALLRQLHPDWTVEELKALVMNYALHDIFVGANGALPEFGNGRSGAGRVDPVAAAQGSVIAFNADDPGLVSLSYNGEVVGTSTQVKNLRVLNMGTAAATYDLSVDAAIDSPGVAFSAAGSVTVPAGGAVEIPVQMDATASQMKHTREASVAPFQAAPAGALAALANVSRHWGTEEAAYLNFSQGGQVKLRVPLYVIHRPASQMAAADVISTGGASTGSTSIALSGSDVCTGTLGAGPTCTGTFPTDEVSLVTPFELQVVSPADPANVPPFADIQYAGVASVTGGLIAFGVSTYGSWTTPTQVSFSIFVDFNEDGVYDRRLFNSNVGTIASAVFGNSANAQDTFVNGVLNIAASTVSVGGAGFFVNRVSSAGADTALFNNNVLFLTATPAQLGLTAGDTTFRWRVQTCTGTNPLCTTPLDSVAGPFFWNSAAQGLNFGGANLNFDLNGASLPVTWNTANMTTNGSLGALLLHHHNSEGRRAEVAVLEGTAQTDLAITKGVSPANPSVGQNVTFTVTVTNNGPGAATGVVVSDPLPNGLTYVSDNGGGAYDPNSGLWTVGNLAVSAGASLQIVATVDTTDQVCNQAEIASVSPLDANAANNRSRVCVMAPRSANLQLAMAVSSPTVLAGDPVTFTLTVTNDGDDPAYGLNISEAFAAFPGLNPTSFTASRGVYDPATGLWNFASLDSGATATLALTFTAPGTPGPLTNNANAGASTSDPDNGDNAASATTTVLSPASVGTRSKTVSGTFEAGGTVTYTVTISNPSAFAQADNPGDEFIDVLPPSLTLVSATATSGAPVATIGTNTVTWNGAIAAGGSVTITITATIDAGTEGTTITNQGTINFDSDGNGTNESTVPTDDPGAGGANDPTSFQVAPLNIVEVPTLSEIGLLLLALLVAATALWRLRRRTAA